MTTLQERGEQLEARANREHPREAWRPEQGQHPNPLTAVVIGHSEVQKRLWTPKNLNVRDLDGNEWAIWLIHSALRSAIEQHNPQPDQLIYLIYQFFRFRSYSGYMTRTEAQKRCSELNETAVGETRWIVRQTDADTWDVAKLRLPGAKSVHPIKPGAESRPKADTPQDPRSNFERTAGVWIPGL